MEANICDISHMDADVLLPPRKRLLAGFKKQTCDGDAALHPPAVASSSSSASPTPPFPSPSPSSPSSVEFQVCLSNLLSSHFNNNANLSPEQILDASTSAASAAAKAAEAARAAAQEKAMIAAKAVTAAKSALALVASFPEEAASKERHSKKNKLKKHVQVQLLYKKHQPVKNYRDDEKLARKLHRVMNSSPRISKKSSASESKGHKNKKPKICVQTSERTRVSNGSVPQARLPPSACNGHAIAGESDSEGSIGGVCTSMVEEKTSKDETTALMVMDNEEDAESSQSKEKTGGEAGSPCKRRGRLKLKKLPLSICSSRDQANPKDGMFPRSSPLSDKNMGNPTPRSKPLFCMEPSAENILRKCQELKAPACAKQNKVIHS